MARWRFVLLLGIGFALSLPLVDSCAQTPSERFVALDSKRYQSASYQALLDTLRRDYPDYSQDTIVSYIYWAYEDLKKYFSGVTVYQVMSGIVEFSNAMQKKEVRSNFEGPQKLEKVISLYLAMKEQESKASPTGVGGFS